MDSIKSSKTPKSSKVKTPKVVEDVVVPVKVEKPKRKPSAYNLFVKEHYKDEDIQALEPKERLSGIAAKWREFKK